MARGLVSVCLIGAAATASATPSPTIAPGPRTVVTFAGGPAKVSLAWPALEGVSRYRARWTDAGAIIDVELPGSATAFERTTTPGRHRLSIVAIDAAGRESAPAETAIEVVAISALAPGADTPVYSPRNAFAFGTRFTSPGMTCQLDSREVGARLLRCAAESGPIVEIPVVIAPVIVDGPHRALDRGRATRIHVTVASVAALGDALDLQPTGTTLGEIERTQTGFAASITPAATGVATLAVLASGIELGRIDLELRDAPAAAPITDDARWFALDVGVRGGALVLPGIASDAIALGKPTRPEDALTTAGFIGAHVGWFPSRYAGLELAAAFAAPRYAGEERLAAMIVSRAQLAGRIVDDGRYGLRLLAGADLLALLSQDGTSQRDLAGGAHYGAAFTIQARDRAWLRLEALHVVTPARDAGFAHAVELSLGVVTRFGRVDR